MSLVLLIACLNFANLFLARSAAKQKETVIRLSLGASRLRIIEQQLVEGFLLAGMSGLGGIALAYVGARVLFTFLSAGQANLSLDLSPDLHVAGFTFASCLVTGFLFSFAPALEFWKSEPNYRLSGEAPRVLGTRIAWRKLLVSAQVAISFLLLIASGLFLRSLQHLRDVHPGFDSHNVLAVSIDPTSNGYKQDQARAFYRKVAERLSQLPGVLAVSFARVGLIESFAWRSGIILEGSRPRDGDPGPFWNVVGADYFSTLRIPILQGREFARSDNRLSKHVAIVSRSFASAYFGSQSPLGRNIGPVRGGDPADYEIVGVAADIKSSGLREKRTPLWYIPYEQHAEVADATFYVRTQGDPKQIGGSIRRVVGNIDARVPLYDIKTLDEQIDRYLSKDRILASGSTLFGVIAAILAAIGLYGVMSYAVATRVPEIGIRMALGAQRSRIIRGVMREVSVTLLIGLSVGIACALALSKYVASLLFGLQPTDAGVLLAAGALMAGVAILAGYVPARRAAQIDPLAALRSE